MLQKCLHAKVCERRSEENRRKFSCPYFFQVKFVAGPVKKFNLIDENIVVLFCDQFIKAAVAELRVYRLDLVPVVGLQKAGDHFGIPVIDAFEIFAGADRPVDRTCSDAEYVFDFINELKRIPCLAVHLIDKGENRHPSHNAHFEQLDRLCLDAFGAVNDHDGRIGSHQRAVRIFGKVLVPRRVKDVNAVSVVIELKNGRSNGNTTFFLYFHPVGYGVLRRLSSFYRAGQVDGSAVEEKFFRQCRLTGIGVGDDRECPSFLSFF